MLIFYLISKILVELVKFYNKSKQKGYKSKIKVKLTIKNKLTKKTLINK